MGDFVIVMYSSYPAFSEWFRGLASRNGMVVIENDYKDGFAIIKSDL